MSPMAAQAAVGQSAQSAVEYICPEAARCCRIDTSRDRTRLCRTDSLGKNN